MWEDSGYVEPESKRLKYFVEMMNEQLLSLKTKNDLMTRKHNTLQCIRTHKRVFQTTDVPYHIHRYG